MMHNWMKNIRFKMEPLSNFVVTRRCIVVEEKPPAVEEVEAELPDGVWQSDGEYVAHCRVCGNTSPIYCDPEEFDPNMHYCGGSPRCCP